MTLQELVDELTLLRVEPVQTGDRVQVIRHEPLLVQLQEAVASRLMKSAGGSSAWTRNMIDSEALTQLETITRKVGSWCEAVGVRPERDAVTDLVAWAGVFLSEVHPESITDFHERELQAWVALIKAMMDPPLSRKDLPGACPVCGADSFTNDQGEPGIPRPLIVEMWDHVARTRASCRACRAVWAFDPRVDGPGQMPMAVRALAHELNAADEVTT